MDVMGWLWSAESMLLLRERSRCYNVQLGDRI